MLSFVISVKIPWGVLDPQVNTGVPPWRREGYCCGYKKRQKPYPNGCSCAIFFKSHPYGCKICEKGTFERLFLTKFEFSVLAFVKFFKIPPLWVQFFKSAKPYPYGCFQGLYNPILWVQNFKNLWHGAVHWDPKYSGRTPPPSWSKDQDEILASAAASTLILILVFKISAVKLLCIGKWRQTPQVLSNNILSLV